MKLFLNCFQIEVKLNTVLSLNAKNWQTFGCFLNFRIKLIKAVRYLRPERRHESRRSGLVSGENQESKEDLITSFGVSETIQSPFKDVQPFKETSQMGSKESDTSTRAITSSETSSSDVISTFNLKPGYKPGTSQYKCSDRPGVLRMKLSKENWKRLAENETNQKEETETKSKKDFLVDETPVVNFTNILRAAFAPISLRQKIQS